MSFIVVNIPSTVLFPQWESYMLKVTLYALLSDTSPNSYVPILTVSIKYNPRSHTIHWGINVPRVMNSILTCLDTRIRSWNCVTEKRT